MSLEPLEPSRVRTLVDQVLGCTDRGPSAQGRRRTTMREPTPLRPPPRCARRRRGPVAPGPDGRNRRRRRTGRAAAAARSTGRVKNVSVATAKNSPGLVPAYAAQERRWIAVADGVVASSAHVDPALPLVVVREQWRPVEDSVVHVDLVGELVEHDVTSESRVDRLPAAARHDTIKGPRRDVTRRRRLAGAPNVPRTGPAVWRWVIDPSRTMIAPTPSYHDSSRPRIGKTAWADTTARTLSVSSKPRAASHAGCAATNRPARRGALARSRQAARQSISLRGSRANRRAAPVEVATT